MQVRTCSIRIIRSGLTAAKLDPFWVHISKDPAIAAPRAPIGGFGYAILADGMALVKAIRNDVQMTHARCAPIAKLLQDLQAKKSPVSKWRYSLVSSYIAIEIGPFEIVDLPIIFIAFQDF